VINNIAYFPFQCAQNSRPVMAAVLDYFQSSGIQTQENSQDSDAALIWSVLWSGRMALNRQVYEHYRAQNKPVIVLEIGALYRGQTWKVAVNNITRDGYYGHEQDLDWDRPKKLRISKAIKFDGDSSVVIAAQHDRSLQVAGLNNMTDWVKHKIQQVRQHTDRDIKVRPHPRCRLDLAQLPRDIVIEQPKPMANTYDSFDMRFDYHAVVNHNSGPGVQAAIAGCRPIVHESSLAAPVGISLADIEKPYDRDLDTWLVQICHTEYTLEELHAGTWLKRIQSAL
jgi:hypothetical protein